MNFSFIEIIIFLLIFSIFLISIRMLKGPTIWDRLVVLNVLTSKVILITIFLSLYYKKQNIMSEKNAFDLLDIGITYALLGFITTVLIARFIERKEHL
ncbi:MAG: monovalent cation/H+ antiporter complex subunit F [Clostridia bacterium]|nr:monovalent cation/H+ antiporter complex subunit F [Clostridia bacterium]